ncbi:MAG: protein kinase [Isosphaeraceae bacterium]
MSEYVEAFETAWAREGEADPAAHAPPPGHPERLVVLCELVRVDLEYRWGQGAPRPLDDYRGVFPDLFADAELLRAAAFEEFRLRDQAGERPDPAEYLHRYGLEVSNRVSARRRPPEPAPDDPTPDGAMRAAAGAYLTYRRDQQRRPTDLNVLLDSYRVPAEHGELLRQLDREDPHAAERLAEAVAGLPRVGCNFLGFQLCRELGRGAFGRVFLARQGDLANRLVALKVSADLACETQALAQLQHTNVVPVYSVHRRGPFQAVCMPYLGQTTLADSLSTLKRQPSLPGSGAGLLSTLRGRGAEGAPAPSARPASTARPALESDGEEAPTEPTPEAPPVVTPQIQTLKDLPYVPAVLWLVSRVADGLAHAHERGILHRDLKPANVLFADDGEPLLLDFSLAADVKTPARASLALVGGTLPYMAPEQLRSFRDDRVDLDARSDVYSLGVILFELLTGTQPFPTHKGGVDDVLPKMLADREGPPPDPRRLNPSVSPATAAIVRHCLESDPARRYPSARALQEDLRRQLDDLPLKHAAEPSLRERVGKWARRHPRLTSSTTVGLVAGLLLIGLAAAFVARQRRYQEADAAASLARLSGERSEAFALLADPGTSRGLVEEGLKVARGVATRYGADVDPDWITRPLVSALKEADRQALRASLGEVFTLAARALTARRPAPEADLGEARRLLDAAGRCYAAVGQEPHAYLLARAEAAGNGPDAEVWRRRADGAPPHSPRERLLAVADRAGTDDRRKLRAFLDAAESLGPADVDPAHWLILGNWSGRLARPDDARHCYGVAIALDPKSPWAHYNRGLIALESGDPAGAVRDFDRVVTLRPDWPAAYMNRALARLARGDDLAAIADLDHCLSLKDPPARAYLVRAVAKERLGDLAGAGLDRAAGLKATPKDADGFVARGLARLPADPRGALADFDAALKLEPRDLSALQDRASVLSEALGRPEEAIRSLDAALESHPDSAATRSGRAVLMARLGRRDEAHRDALAAVETDDRALMLYQAACVFALTSRARAGRPPRGPAIPGRGDAQDPPGPPVPRPTGTSTPSGASRIPPDRRRRNGPRPPPPGTRGATLNQLISISPHPSRTAFNGMPLGLVVHAVLAQSIRRLPSKPNLDS